MEQLFSHGTDDIKSKQIGDWVLHSYHDGPAKDDDEVVRGAQTTRS